MIAMMFALALAVNESVKCEKVEIEEEMHGIVSFIAWWHGY